MEDQHRPLRAARLLLLMALLLLPIPAAWAAEAQDVAARCDIRATENAAHWKYMLSDDNKQRWDAGEAGYLKITMPQGKTCQGVMLSFYDQETAVNVYDGSGDRIGTGTGQFRIEYIPFSREVSAFTIQRKNRADPLTIARLRVLTAGELPQWVQRWEMPEGAADLMLVATHPDDEILWFGGLLPYYAGELNKRVIVVYMVGGLNPVRTLELLNGLWHMGVKWYPDIGSFENVGLDAMGSIYASWGRDGAATRITEVIRRYKPQVVVTQDIRGEYGHQAHVATVQAVIDVIEKGISKNKKKYPESAAQWGAWSPKKLYIHLWKENEIRFDWNQPLRAFNGKTGLQIAKAAYKMHVSQQKGVHRRSVKDSGQYDCSRFGLYWSSVGADKAHKDLFENISEKKQ